MSTIGASEESKKFWKEFKNFPQESYESVINRIFKQSLEDDFLSEEDLKDIQKSLEQFKNGEYVTFEEIKKKHAQL